jgi:hypothetical protein
MADGAKINHWIDEGTVATTDATETTVCSITIPTGTDGMLYISGWLVAYESGQSAPRRATVTSCGVVNNSIVSASGQHKDLDSGGSYSLSNLSWNVDVDDDGAAAVRLRAIGAVGDNVRWYGHLEATLVECVITTA